MPFASRYALSLVCLLACGAPSVAAPAPSTGTQAAEGQPAVRQLADPALAGGTALAQGQTGFIWLGTPQGLVRWDGTRARRYAGDGAHSGSLPDSDILSLYRDGAGRLWVGTGAGLARYDAQTDRFLVFPAGPGGLSSGRITALADDGRGGLWVGTGAGLEHVRADGRVLSAASGAPRLAAQALGGGVDALLRDASGALWIGSAGGLYTRASDTRPVTPVTLPDARDAAITALHQDSAGRIWIGTRASGAFVLDPSGSAVRRVGGAHDQVLSLAERSPELMWIALADGAVLEFDHRGNAQRRVQLPGAANALLRERSGQMFAATPAALVQLEPLARAGAPAKVAVTRLLAGGRDLPVAPFNAPVVTRAALQLTPEERARGFELEFGPLDYAAEAGQLSYKLKGFDADWIATDGRARRASYTNLPPGDYTLQLRAGSSRGSDGVHSLEVRVLRAWHEHLLVRALGLLAVLSGAGALVYAKITRMRARQDALQADLDARALQVKALQNEIEIITHSDALTGLANRRCLNDELQLLADEAAEGGERFTLLLLDLDRFGELNTSFGYALGDAVLVEIAQRLKRTMRDGDLVARFGDDEFAVLMPLSLPPDIIERICTRILNNLAKPMTIGEHTLQVSASVGAGSFISCPGALERLYKTAGSALAASKQAARAAWQNPDRAAA